MADSKWTREEHKACLETYFLMLRLESENTPFVKREMINQLTTGALKNRTRASIEYRFQNISAVLQEKGRGWVRGYKPRKNVGTNIRALIEELISELVAEPSAKLTRETESSEDLRKNKSELLGPTFGPPPRSSGYAVTQNSGNELAYIYVARFGNTNIYKIGFAQNPTERLREFNHHIPLVELPDLQSWKIIFQSSALLKADAYKMEQATLNVLSSSRTTGERVLCSEFELYRALKSVGIKSSGL